MAGFKLARLKKLLIVTLALAVSLGLAGLAVYRLNSLYNNVPPEESMGLPVYATVAEEGPIDSTVTYSGTVRAVEEAVLEAKIMAEVKAVNCTEGDRVQSGQVLVTLDNKELLQKANTLERRINSAEINLRHWESEVDTYKSLAEQGAISRHEYESIVFQRDTAAAALEEAFAALEETRSALSDTTLKSPLTGTVTAVHMEEGEMGAPGKPIVTVSGSSLMVVTGVTEGDLTHIKEGTEVKLEFPCFKNEVVSAVDKIYPAVNKSTRTAEVEVPVPPEFTRDTGLRPGMSTGVSMVLAQREDVLLVPVSAVKNEGEEKFLFVIKDGKAVKRPVQTGIQGATRVEITGGLEVGERVAESPPADLYDGRKVYMWEEESRS